VLTVSFVHRASNALTLFRNDCQVSDSGLVTGGVGAEATATPVVVKDVPPGVTVTGPPNGALAAHLVANGFLTFLAAVFGITLM
jgi:hypothetical protein